MPPKSAKGKEAPAERPILGRFSSHLKIGIVGLPNVGKSTLFNTLTKLSIPAENFPFCTIEPNEARVNIPDERFDWLCQLYKPKSEVSAFLEIHDIAGLVRATDIRQQYSTGAFEDPDIIHVDDTVDPVRDLEIISAELRLKDIEFMERRIEDVEKSMKRSNDKQLKVEHELCGRLKAWLEDGKDIRLGDWKAADVEILNTFQLLTAKPVVYLVNMNERDYQRKKNKFLPKIHAWVQEHGGEKIIPFSCALERNLADLPPDEAAKYCEENKVESALPKIIKTGFAAINLIYFFTAGPDEVKCWQIRRLSKAPQAAGTIHTDFERGFICAEVMKFEDLKELGSEPAVKAAGKYRQEGKTYVVQDGDIIFFKFNVSGGGKKMSMRLGGLLVLSLFFFSAMGQLPSQDILALLAFKKGIKHDPTGFVLSSWNDESIDFNGCPASWNGIICNGGNVAGVVLDNLSLSADVDLSVFSNLTKLLKLSMANNMISGKFPDNIADFNNLEFLDLSNNLFSSSLPPGIGKLGSLRNLSLGGNNFSGSIPDSISGLSAIQSLDLSRNSFSGPLPSALTKLSSLVSLNLSSNGFTKSLPKGFDLLSSLDVLDLQGNMLDGPLDKAFLMEANATHVDFSGNMFTSSGSQGQMFLPRLSESIKYLNLSHNQLMGSLVGGSELQIFENLKVLDLSYNQLSGELPGFNFVYDLQVLKLSNNRFTGVVPNGLIKGDSLVLNELDLSGNNLSGPINMVTSTTLRILNLSSNGLTGKLPLLTGSCAVLDLSKNKFEGNLTRVVKWGNIEYLDLSQNLLTGPIPDITPQFLRLNYLNLSHNSLSSSIASVITQYPKISVLDLSSNQLDGTVLAELLSMPTLQELHLENNLLSGSINISSPLFNQSNLQVLDLSQNRLSGYFPDQFGSLNGLKVLNIGRNNFSGSLPTSMSDMSTLSSLDISQNHFTGPLPNNLPNSLEFFNASYNDLSGDVPENLRKFPSSCFYPGNTRLRFPNGGPPGSNSSEAEHSKRKPFSTLVKVIIIVSCVVVVFILLLLAIFIHYIRMSRRIPSGHTASKDIHKRAPPNSSGARGAESAGALVVSAGDLVASRKGSSSEIISSGEKVKAVSDFSPSKNSHFSWSPESGDSYIAENLARLDVRSPDRLVGELHFLDETIALTPEALSRAPAEVLGRSSHGTSYKATLDNGLFLTVKWLKEGVAKQKKEFAKEAKKFANMRHPNVVGLRGYYWGPTQHEKLILSDYISPGSLASFLYDRPGRKGPPLTWAQRLKIAVDVARGLNYLHFDRAVPHGNLKATNVLLDGSDLNARVADYCLHRLMTQAGTIEQILDAGVLGYCAPELAASKKPLPSFKSDVYAFGVILLELLTGRCAGDVISGEGGGADLTDWVRLRVAEGRGSDCFDATLVTEIGNPAAEKGMKEVLGISLRCIRSVSERPVSDHESVGLRGKHGSLVQSEIIASSIQINCNAMERFSDIGAAAKETPFEVAEASDVVITMLPTSSHVYDVYTGPNGLLYGENLLPRLFIDSSTTDPQISRKLSTIVSNCTLKKQKEDHWKKPAFLDAPVSGGVLAAEAGTLTFMLSIDEEMTCVKVAGSEEAYIAAKPLFLSMGKNTVYCGGAGNGSTAMICYNLALAISMIGISESLALGQSLGISASTLTKVFNSSSARCWSSDSYNPVPGVMEGVPSSRNYDGGFASKLMAKDVNIAATSAKEVGLRYIRSSVRMAMKPRTSPVYFAIITLARMRFSLTDVNVYYLAAD
ncbi:hypothetical protein ACLB2K_032718 [Fragaria x ananassa]